MSLRCRFNFTWFFNYFFFIIHLVWFTFFSSSLPHAPSLSLSFSFFFVLCITICDVYSMLKLIKKFTFNSKLIRDCIFLKSVNTMMSPCWIRTHTHIHTRNHFPNGKWRSVEDMTKGDRRQKNNETYIISYLLETIKLRSPEQTTNNHIPHKKNTITNTLHTITRRKHSSKAYKIGRICRQYSFGC